MKNLNSTWLKAALIRALKTAAQTAVGTITMGAALDEVNWFYILSTSLVAAIVSILTSIEGLPETSVNGTVIVNQNGDVSEFNLVDNELKDEQIVHLKVKR